MSKHRFINVRSVERDTASTSCTDFRYSLAHSITNPKRISLCTAIIPNMSLNIRSNYNTFTWTDSSSISWTATVTAGSYTISTLLTALASAMNTQTGLTYTFSYSTTTYKVSLSVASSITIGTTNLSTALGLSAQSGTSITASNAYCLSAWDTAWTVQISNISSSYGNKTQFKTFVIPIDVETGYVCYFYERTAFEQYTDIDHMGSLSYLQIKLVDSFGNTVDNQGVDWQMILKVTY